MRIIDADELLCQLDKRRTYEFMNGRNKAYCKGVRDAMKDTDAATTIAAIPVEWLREFDLYYAGISGGTKYMNELVEAWQKGQEAR